MVCRLLFVLTFLCIFLRAEILVKHLAGPPSEFPPFLPLVPASFPVFSNSAAFKVHLVPHHDRFVLAKTVNLVVDSKNEFRFAFFSPHSPLLELSLNDPSGKPVTLQGTPSFMPIGEEQIPATVYIITRPVQGLYQLQIKTASLDNSTYHFLTSNSQEDGYVILWNEDTLEMHTTFNTFNHVVGNKVGLVTSVFDSSLSSSGARKVVKARKQVATMNVRYPDGENKDFPMFDDGLHSDNEPSDGIYGALITANVAGQYIFEASISGADDEGVQFIRTSSQVVHVVPHTIALSGVAVATLDRTQTRAITHIEAAAPVGKQYHAYAEVWGKDGSGNDVPISWIGGMTFVHLDDGASIPLELDLNWISMAGAQGPLTLRNVQVKDPDYFVPIAQYDEIPVTLKFSLESILASQSLKGPKDEITEEMKLGSRPQRNSSVEAAPTVYTVLVHGYCSGANPFQSNPAGTWTNGKFFLKANANMLNDVFATNVISWAQQNKLEAYSYVGHSQGGMVGAHMYNFYWTGLDYVDEKKGHVIQTLGTPFQGCSAAGTAANLGYLFGISCGANDNLTPTGAMNWLQTITTETRKQVTFYTTTYAQGQPFGDYCNLAMNIILEFPNDGTTEYNRALLPSGNNAGNVQRWCHIAGMKYPAQYTDETRVKIINANAARTYKP